MGAPSKYRYAMLDSWKYLIGRDVSIALDCRGRVHWETKETTERRFEKATIVGFNGFTRDYVRQIPGGRGTSWIVKLYSRKGQALDKQYHQNTYVRRHGMRVYFKTKGGKFTLEDDAFDMVRVREVGDIIGTQDDFLEKNVYFLDGRYNEPFCRKRSKAKWWIRKLPFLKPVLIYFFPEVWRTKTKVYKLIGYCEERGWLLGEGGHTVSRNGNSIDRYSFRHFATEDEIVLLDADKECTEIDGEKVLNTSKNIISSLKKKGKFQLKKSKAYQERKSKLQMRVTTSESTESQEA